MNEEYIDRICDRLNFINLSHKIAFRQEYIYNEKFRDYIDKMIEEEEEKIKKDKKKNRFQLMKFK